MEGCGPHCPCWRRSDPWVFENPGQWGYCQRDEDRYEGEAPYILVGDLSRTKEEELEKE